MSNDNKENFTSIPYFDVIVDLGYKLDEDLISQEGERSGTYSILVCKDFLADTGKKDFLKRSRFEFKRISASRDDWIVYYNATLAKSKITDNFYQQKQKEWLALVESGQVKNEDRITVKEFCGIKSDHILITDENVYNTYHDLPICQQAKKVITVQAGEKSKSLKNVEKILTEILALGVSRGITLFALGGGVVGDLTGFIASILLRGVHFVQIPTTLLAQIDSSVGGKTGVNSMYGKNLIGSFYQPKRVIIDLNFLQSLPDREFKAGYAEIVKYALIYKQGDSEKGALWDVLSKNHKNFFARDVNTISLVIVASCGLKAKIVIADEKEQTGLRSLLNFGHTFGHAIEGMANYDTKIINHGEAVAIGMIMAICFSIYLGTCQDYSILQEVCNHYDNVGLPKSFADIDLSFDPEKIVEYIKKDKKNIDEQLVFILLEKIGKAIRKEGVKEAKLREFLAEYQTGKYSL